eukprot:TRINITY_DN31250_c0_g1_i1.p1 TRINITY_DN31250_c0_g1~~TRINITY_DN31250_c0_g1_i1.p1  ORF type:complete len:431 (+),score=60.95 TRINITY_DN31250_c0_g1_i1:110-1402(+)
MLLRWWILAAATFASSSAERPEVHNDQDSGSALQTEGSPPHAASTVGRSPSNIDLRPNQNNDKADNVTIRIRVDQIWNMNLKVSSASVRFFLVSEWSDSRAARSVTFPVGHESVTLPESVADKDIWIPILSVGNRLGDESVIADSVTVYKNGNVSRSQWISVETSQDFDGQDYPVDIQQLYVSILASSYPVEHLQLLPAQGTAVRQVKDYEQKAFSNLGYEPIASVHTALVESDRSEVRLEIEVQRYLMTTVANIIMPNLFVVVMAYLSLFFPVGPGYAMPRTGTLITCYMSLMTLTLRETGMVPDGGSVRWMGCLQTSMQLLLLLLFAFNTITEYAAKENEELALSLKREMRYLFPGIMTLVFVVLCVRIWIFTSEVVVFGVCIGYLLTVVQRIYFPEKEAEEPEEGSQHQPGEDKSGPSPAAGSSMQT